MCGGTWEALESEQERGALVHTQLIEKAATFLRAAERRLAGKFKATAERRGGGRQQRGARAAMAERRSDGGGGAKGSHVPVSSGAATSGQVQGDSRTAKRRAAAATRAVEVEQIDSKAKQIGADGGAGVPVLRSKCRIKDLTASTLEG